MLIDTHCHLTYEGLWENLPAVVQRASAAGVLRLLTIGTDLDDHARVLDVLRRYPGVFAALGIHPNHGGEVEPGFEGFLENRIRHEPKVLAVGECGLDYAGDRGPPKLLQRGVFITQLEMARRLAKPVILHVREAHADALAIMQDYTDLAFVVHCFTGTPQEAQAWLDLGAYIGITGIVTFKSADLVRQDAQLVPPERLLVETDSPYLSPEPVRKAKINEPAHVVHVARYVAELRGVSESELARQTSANAARLFGSALLS